MNLPHNAISDAEQIRGGGQDRLELVARVTGTLVGSAPPRDQMNEAAQEVRHAFRADACLIRALEGGDLVLLGCAGMPREHQRTRIPSGWGICGELLNGLRPLFISDARDSHITQSFANMVPNAYRFCSYAGAPLVVGGRRAGILSLYFTQPARSVHPIDLSYLQTVANPIALAIVNYQLSQEVTALKEEIEIEAQERRDLDIELLHAQKLVSVGRLSGQVAHDFNNMLSVIIGFNSYARDELNTDDPAQDYLDKVAAASMRTKSLISQLLAFAHKEIIAPSAVKVQPLMRDTAQMLVPLLGPRINLEIDIRTKRDTVFVDSGQLEHVLVNLMVNARDAMSGAGTLTLRLDHCALDEADCEAHGELQPGAYVCIEVSDTGCGIADDVKAHIFEPFFTTKVQGQGTGLGLASCYGAIRQNSGEIQVESSPGNGSTFRILLPYVALSKATAEEEDEEPGIARGSEAVLLVESEPWVRDVESHGLRSYGYTVHPAASAREALDAALAHCGRFSILVTETVLPDMDGCELSRRLTALFPHINTLFVSGYAESDSVGDVADLDRSLVLKPFTPEALASRVRAVLDGEASHSQ